MKSKDEEFPISNYPLEQTEFYYEQKQGMACSILLGQLVKVILVFLAIEKVATS